jgi:hypothetical protein
MPERRPRVDDRELDIAYLNRFMAQLWPGISGILQAEVTHRVFKEARSQPGRISRRRTRLHFSSPPRILPNGPTGLKLRIPGTGTNRLSTRIFLLPRIPLPRINADIDLSVEMEIKADADPDTRLEGLVRSNAVGNLIDRVFPWKSTITSRFAGEELKSELGYFGTARYTPPAVPRIPKPELVYPDRPRLDRAVNIVLVPDSFSSAYLSRFDQTVDAIVSKLSLPDGEHANEPFYSFKTALHVWTITPDQSPDGDHVMGTFRDPRGHRRVALANLARIAAIGRAAESSVSGVSILTFIVNREAPRFAGDRPTAMALGNVIMQPIQRTPDEDASLFLHEIGHTGLARLGDEYVLRSRTNERYLGQPLSPPNLTSDPSLHKWKRWRVASQLPSWDQQPITGAEGAGYFGLGIWRPAERCAMRQSREGLPYCAVCREAMAKGIRDALGEDEFLLRIDDAAGSREYISVSATNTGRMAGQISTMNKKTPQFEVMVIAGNIPEPWEVSATFTGAGEMRETSEEDPEPGLPASRSRFSVSASAGDILRLRIRSLCPFTPWDPIPAHEIELTFADAQDV